MPRYYFNVYDGHSSRDMDGTELQSCATAQLMAVKLAGEILRDDAEGVVLDEDWRLEVVDAAGCVVFEVHVLLSANAPLEPGLPN